MGSQHYLPPHLADAAAWKPTSLTDMGPNVYRHIARHATYENTGRLARTDRLGETVLRPLQKRRRHAAAATMLRWRDADQEKVKVATRALLDLTAALVLERPTAEAEVRRIVGLQQSLPRSVKAHAFARGAAGYAVTREPGGGEVLVHLERPLLAGNQEHEFPGSVEITVLYDLRARAPVPAPADPTRRHGASYTRMRVELPVLRYKSEIDRNDYGNEFELRLERREGEGLRWHLGNNIWKQIRPYKRLTHPPDEHFLSDQVTYSVELMDAAEAEVRKALARRHPIATFVRDDRVGAGGNVDTASNLEWQFHSPAPSGSLPGSSLYYTSNAGGSNARSNATSGRAT